MTRDSIFLVITAIGLIPIALSYGLLPEKSPGSVFAIDANSINTVHMFRAIMGLYLGLVIFWIAGAKSESLRIPALWSLTFFMLGLAAGRVASLVIDGMPHPLLLVFLVLELVFGFIGYYLIRRSRVN
jgi:hypothetical protein